MCLNMCWQSVWSIWLLSERRAEEWEWEKMGGPDLADDSVNGVITSVPLRVQYKREVTHRAKLLPSFPSFSTLSWICHSCFWRVGGGFLWSCSVWVCVSGLCRSMCEYGYDTQTILTVVSLNCRDRSWEKCLLYVLLLCKFYNVS